MNGQGPARRVVVSTLVFLAVVVAGVGWAEVPPAHPTVENAVTLAPPPGLAVDAALQRPDILSGSWAEHRGAKGRVRLDLAVLVSLSVLLAVGTVARTRSFLAPDGTLRRRWSVTLRAPPALRLA